MITIKDFAMRVAHYLATETQLNDQDREVIRFGVESLVAAVIGIAAAVGVAWWLGITPYVLAALGTSMILRLVSGGAHCSTFLRCLALGTAIVAGIGKLASLLSAPQVVLFALLVLFLAGGWYAVYRWGPADTPARPIVSPAKRAGYRRLAYVFLAVWAAGVCCLAMVNTPSASGLALASIGGVGWQIFSITPAGYRLVVMVETLIDKSYEFFQARKPTV